MRKEYSYSKRCVLAIVTLGEKYLLHRRNSKRYLGGLALLKT